MDSWKHTAYYKALPRWKQVLLENPDLFFLRYFPNRIRKLEDFHLRLVNTCLTVTRGLIEYPAGHGKCCVPDTAVLMANGTLRAAADVAVGDETAAGRCERSGSNGVGPVLRVKIRTGQEIVVTPNHPFWIRERGWVPAGDLVSGDEVVLCENFEPLFRQAATPEELRLLGYFVGDGCVVNGSCNITSNDPEVIADFYACAESLGFERGFQQGNRYDLKGGVRDWLRARGAYGKGSHEKRVPPVVFGVANDSLEHFLAAYFSCDGSFSRATSGFEFYSVSKGLLQDVQHLLLRLGIVASLTVKNGRYKGEHHLSWRLRIPSVAFDQIRTWPIVLERKRPPRGEDLHRFLPTVTEVSDAGEQETWALQVSGGVHYTADILTHNTTLASTLCPILEVCRNPDVRIAIIQKNEADADSVMTDIQAELVDNDLLVQDFGPFKPPPESQKPWALGRMSVAKRTLRHKSATIHVFGSGARTVLGYRTDWTICDDVVTDKNSSSPTQRERIKDWFELSVETGPEHIDSRITVVGTRFDPNDLYGDLEEMVNPESGERLWQLQKEDAIQDEENHRTLWEERWPWLRLLEQKAKTGTLSFNKRYRNIAVDASRMVFREQYVRGGWVGTSKYPGCLDRSYRIGEHGDNWRLVSGFDPAVGTGRNAKFCAHVVLAEASCRDHERCFWVVDLERQQLTLPQQVELILNKHQQYSMFRSVVEANSYQAGLLQAIENKMDEVGQRFAVEPHYTSRSLKPNPEIGVQAMAPWFEKGEVHIPWADAHSQRRMGQLVDELIMYPDSRTTDTVMAFWFAWRSLQESAPKFGSYNRMRSDPRLKSLSRMVGRRVSVNPYYVQESRNGD